MVGDNLLRRSIDRRSVSKIFVSFMEKLGFLASE